MTNFKGAFRGLLLCSIILLAGLSFVIYQFSFHISLDTKSLCPLSSHGTPFFFTISISHFRIPPISSLLYFSIVQTSMPMIIVLAAPEYLFWGKWIQPAVSKICYVHGSCCEPWKVKRALEVMHRMSLNLERLLDIAGNAFFGGMSRTKASSNTT